MASKFTHSSPQTPCPICSRTKDQDCRTLEQNNVVLCHTHPTDPNEIINGYKFLRPSKDGLWGVFVWQEPEQNGKVKGRKLPRRQERQEYFYPDRQGNPLVKVQRVPKADGKDFYQYHWNGSEWVPGIPDAIREQIPVYRYQQVREAIEARQPILVVEGETCSDALWGIGIPSTTTIGGSKKYRSYGNYKQDLEGASIILCPDRDKLGIEHMEDVSRDFPEAQWCRVYPKSPIWSCLPDNGGLDVEDWIQDGARFDDILGAIEAFDSKKSTATPKTEQPKIPTYDEALNHVNYLEDEFAEDAELEWQVRNYAYESGLAKRGFNGPSLLRLARERRDGAKAIQVVTSKQILERHKEGRQWVINGLVPLGTTIVLAAIGGLGKSSLTNHLVKCIETGQDFSGLTARKGRCLIIQADEPETDMADKLDIANFYDVPDVDIIQEWRFSQLRQLEQLIKRNKYLFIVIDSYTACHAGLGVELTKSSAGDSVYTLRNMAHQYGCTFLIVHHNNKGNGMRDSSTINDNPSEIWSLYRDKEDETLSKNDLVLEITKSRAGLAGKYLLTRNPIDYSWTYCGAYDGSDVQINKVVKFIRDHPSEMFTIGRVSEQMRISYDEANSRLEQARRFGLIGAKWVLREDGDKARYRMYFAMPKVKPDETESDRMESVELQMNRAIGRDWGAIEDTDTDSEEEFF